MKLFVDDIRQAPQGYIRARTITEAIRFLSTYTYEAVSLDHDIAYLDERGVFTGKCSDENFTAVAHYIAQMPDTEKPKLVFIHTANPDGAKALMSILADHAEVLRVTHYAHEWGELDGIREIAKKKEGEAECQTCCSKKNKQKENGAWRIMEQFSLSIRPIGYLTGLLQSMLKRMRRTTL